VRNGVFAHNELSGNGGHGISIGHKDTDNVLRNNVVRANARNGVLFRDETEPMAGHRNRLEQNRIEDNGGDGIFIDGETDGVVIRENVISDTRQGSGRTQRVAIRLGEKARTVVLDGNRIAADIEIEDQRKSSR
jgi:parallel beta-helix repeat protein